MTASTSSPCPRTFVLAHASCATGWRSSSWGARRRCATCWRPAGLRVASTPRGGSSSCCTGSVQQRIAARRRHQSDVVACARASNRPWPMPRLPSRTRLRCRAAPGGRSLPRSVHHSATPSRACCPRRRRERWRRSAPSRGASWTRTRTLGAPLSNTSTRLARTWRSSQEQTGAVASSTRALMPSTWPSPRRARASPTAALMCRARRGRARTRCLATRMRAPRTGRRCALCLSPASERASERARRA